MKPGFFLCIVGPSGAGKDSLIDAAREQLPSGRFEFARRIITRDAGKPGEIYDSCTEAEFDAKQRAGEFLVTWQAHGLNYGLPGNLRQAQAHGKHIIANGSRSILQTLKHFVPNLIIIEITAPIDILARRILQRGRETETEIRERLARKVDPLPDDLPVYTIHNDKTLQEAIHQFMNVIHEICDA